jgi:hypothetical protein
MIEGLILEMGNDADADGECLRGRYGREEWCEEYVDVDVDVD